MNELLIGSLLFVTLVLSIIPVFIPIRRRKDITYNLLKRCRTNQRCKNLRDQVHDEDMIIGAQICNCLVFLVLFIMILCCFPRNSKISQNTNKVLSIILVLLLVAVSVLFNLNTSIQGSSIDWGFGVMMASILTALITTILIYSRSSSPQEKVTPPPEFKSSANVIYPPPKFKSSANVIYPSDKYNYTNRITNVSPKVNKNYKDFLAYKKDRYNIPNNYNKTFSPYKKKNVRSLSFNAAPGEYV